MGETANAAAQSAAAELARLAAAAAEKMPLNVHLSKSNYR